MTNSNYTLKELFSTLRMRLLLAVLLTLLPVVTVLAQNGGAHRLDWWTADGGGGASSGGPYTMIGTIGQHDAGFLLSGGDYTLAGGFWGIGMAAPSRHYIYLPLVNRGDNLSQVDPHQSAPDQDQRSP